MRRPEEMSRQELIDVIRSIRAWLWVTEDSPKDIEKLHGKEFLKKCLEDRGGRGRQFIEYFDPEKEWDSDITAGIAEAMSDAGLNPDGLLPISAGQSAKPKHSWTPIAPETQEDSCDHDPATWYWCTKCGCMKLAGCVYKPGPNQKKNVVTEKKDPGCTGELP